VAAPDDETLVVGRLEATFDAALALDVGLGLHGHVGADEALEVGWRAERTLETGARHLEGVAAGNGVVTVKSVGDDQGGLADAVEVDAAGPVDGHAQGGAQLLDIDDLDIVGGEQGLDQFVDTVRDTQVGHLLSPFSKQKRGPKPTPIHPRNDEQKRGPVYAGVQTFLWR